MLVRHNEEALRDALRRGARTRALNPVRLAHVLHRDALNFTGQTTIGVTDSSGNLVSRVDVDFDNDTISVDGGTPTTSASGTWSATWVSP